MSNNTFSTAPFIYNRRIYYADTDAASVVYYANYLILFEEARTEWLRSLGFNQSTLRDEHQTLFLVKSVRELNYFRPAHLDDILTITCEPTSATKASASIKQTAYREGSDKLLVTADIELVCVDASSGRPKRIPSDITSSFRLRRNE